MSGRPPATYLGSAPGGGELWKVGRALAAVPALPDRLPADLKEAMARRRATILEGECPCGARLDLDTAGAPGTVAHADAAHDPACPAHDRNTARLVRLWRRAQRRPR